MKVDGCRKAERERERESEGRKKGRGREKEERNGENMEAERGCVEERVKER